MTVRQILGPLGVALLLTACGSNGGSTSTLPTVSVSPGSPASRPLDRTPGPGFDPTSFVWTEGPNLPVAVSEIGVALVGGNQIHVVGGYIRGKPHHSVHVYLDLTADKWVTAADLPDQLDHVGTTSVDGMLYAMGGYSPKGVTDEVFRWDPATNRWTTLPPMPTPRAAAVAVVLDGKIHLIGGRDSQQRDITRHDVYDPATGAWTTASPIPRATDHTAYAVVGGKVHVVGGRPGENTEHDVYDPATNSWSTAAPLPAPRNSFAGADFGGKFVVMGGENSTETEVFGDVWAWDPATNAWTTLTKLPQPVQGIGAAVAGERLYVPAGGPGAGPSLETDRLQILESPADGPGQVATTAPGY